MEPNQESDDQQQQIVVVSGEMQQQNTDQQREPDTRKDRPMNDQDPWEDSQRDIQQEVEDHNTRQNMQSDLSFALREQPILQKEERTTNPLHHNQTQQIEPQMNYNSNVPLTQDQESMNSSGSFERGGEKFKVKKNDQISEEAKVDNGISLPIALKTKSLVNSPNNGRNQFKTITPKKSARSDLSFSSHESVFDSARKARASKQTTPRTSPRLIAQELEKQNEEAQSKSSTQKLLWYETKSARFDVHAKTKYYDHRSLFIFSGKNQCRKKLVWLVEWKYFDYLVTLVIVLNSIMLAMTDFNDRLYNDYVSQTNELLLQIDYVFTVIFIIECLLKVLAFGFIMHKNSYLRDVWNWLDFFVVAISIVDFVPGLNSNSSLKALRTFRILRPLRSINSMPRMKELIGTLLKSIPGLVSVVIFLLFVFSIFGIFGVHQFQGAFYKRCRQTMEPVTIDGELTWPINFDAEWLCLDDLSCARQLGEGVLAKCGALSEYGIPLSADKVYNQELISYGLVGFDDFSQAMFTIFQVLTLEGWSLIMYNYKDSVSAFLSAFFFFSVVIFGAMFTMNLVLAQIMDSFAKEQHKKQIEQENKDNMKKMEKIERQRTKAIILHNQRTERMKEEQHKKDTSSNDPDPKKDETVSEKADVLTPGRQQKSPMFRADKSTQIHDGSEVTVQKDGTNGKEGSSITLSTFLPQLNQKQVAMSDFKLMEQQMKQGNLITHNVTMEGFFKKNDNDSNIELDQGGLTSQQQSPMHSQLEKDINDLESSIEEDKVQRHQFLQTIMEDGQQVKDTPEKSHHQHNDSNFAFVDKNNILVVDEQKEEQSKQKILSTSEIDIVSRSQTNICFKTFYRVCSHPMFNFIIFLLIIANTATLASDSYPQDEQKTKNLAIANNFFTWIFFTEMVIKLIGLGPKNYVKDKFNLFDGIVVIVSLIEFAISESLDDDKVASASDVMYAFRALRLLRVIKIIRAWKQMKIILSKTIKSMKDISNFVLLLFLFIYIFALLGMELFANKIRFDSEGLLVNDIKDYDGVDMLVAPRASFDTIFKALTTIFILIIGEDWNWIAYDYIRVMGEWTKLYFIVLMIIGNVILLSLFTAILLQNFESDNDEEEIEQAEENTPVKDNQSTSQKTIKRIITFTEGLKTAFSLKSEKNDIRPVDKKEQEQDNSKSQDSEPDIQFEDQNEKQHQQDFSNKMGQVQPFEKNIVSNQVTNNESLGRSKSSHKLNMKIHYETFLEQKNVTKQVNTDDVINRSLCLFGPTNKLRLFIAKIVKHQYFERFILALIIISTILLAFETPLIDPNGTQIEILYYFDVAISSIFFLEMILKIFTYGFLFNGKYSYLLSAWNILDFVIVVASMVTISPNTVVKLSFFKSLRLLRVLRPLRVISRSRQLRLAIESLFKSFKDILNLLLVTTFFTFLLAILSTTLLGGKFYHCEMDHLQLTLLEKQHKIVTKWDCLNYGGVWVNPDLHFDNTLNSMLTFISIQTTEGWIDVMWNAADVTQIDYQPKIMASWWYVPLFMFIIVILCLLFLNLFVGVVIDTFNKENTRQSLNHLLTYQEKNFIQVQLEVYKAKPIIEIHLCDNCLRNVCIKIVRKAAFETFIMVCIILNTIVLALSWYQQSEQFIEVVEYINYIFMGIFTIEAIIKIIAMKRNYFRDRWNVFDFIIVIGSITMLIVSIQSNDQTDFGMQSTILRSLRIGRVFRIVKRARNLQVIFQTLLITLPSMASLGLLLILLLFLYSIIGIQLFSQVKLQSAIDEHANFQTFPNAFLLLMRSATGEAWEQLMFDSGRRYSLMFQCNENPSYESYVENGYMTDGCGSKFAIAYFLSFQIIVSQIFLNLFIAIIIDAFINQSEQMSLPINQNDIDDFQECWRKFDPDATGYIHHQDLESFILMLVVSQQSSLISYKQLVYDKKKLRMYLAKLNIPIYNNFKKYMFYDVLQTLAHQACEKEYYKEFILHDAKKSKVLSQWKGIAVTEDELMLNTHENLIKKLPIGFQSFDEIIVNDILKKDSRIELLQSLKAKSSNIGKRYYSLTDKSIRGDDCLYTSRHVTYGIMIISHWKCMMEKKRFKKLKQSLTAQSMVLREPEPEPSQTPELIQQHKLYPQTQTETREPPVQIITDKSNKNSRGIKVSDQHMSKSSLSEYENQYGLKNLVKDQRASQKESIEILAHKYNIRAQSSFKDVKDSLNMDIENSHASDKSKDQVSSFRQVNLEMDKVIELQQKDQNTLTDVISPQYQNLIDKQ